MGSIYKKTHKRPIPKGAEIVVKRGKTLAEWIEMEATCPACESQQGYRSPNPDPTERDMKAWLAEDS